MTPNASRAQNPLGFSAQEVEYAQSLGMEFRA